MLEDKTLPSLLAGLDKTRLERVTRDSIDALPEREQKILRWRFGLAGDREHTLEEIGGMLGLSRERVRQIEMRALMRLREGEHRRQLAEFVAIPDSA